MVNFTFKDYFKDLRKERTRCSAEDVYLGFRRLQSSNKGPRSRPHLARMKTTSRGYKERSQGERGNSFVRQDNMICEGSAPCVFYPTLLRPQLNGAHCKLVHQVSVHCWLYERCSRVG